MKDLSRFGRNYLEVGDYLEHIFPVLGIRFIYKINLAKEMLDGPMLVYEVCAQVGFENANYFSKIFRRYTGCTPSEFKKAGKAGLP